MKINKIARGYIEVGEGGRHFRVYGEGLLPKGDGVEYVVYANSPVECQVTGGAGVFADERTLTDADRQLVLAFLKAWAAQTGRRWDFE
jgi:hypothetical protein